MLKKKLSILLCTMMITGCFAQSALAEEVKTNNTKPNTTITETTNGSNDNKTVKAAEQQNTNKASEKTANSDNKNQTANTSASQKEFPKIDFQMFSAKEAFDTEFHSLAYQEGLRNRVLNEKDPLQKYFSQATMITCYNQNFTNALNKIQEYKIKTFDDGYKVEYSKMCIKDYTEYKNTHKNISKDALDIINECINQFNATIGVSEKDLKNDTALFNKYLKEARSYETPENKDNLENVLTTGIMQLYWDSKEIPLDIKSLKEIPANDKSTIEYIVKNASNTNKKDTPAKKDTTKTKTTPVTKTKVTSNKTLPKTGGSCAAPIASVSLILSGAALAIFNKIKRH